MNITLETVAQALSFVGLAFIVASYQQKKKSSLILFQLFGCGIFCIHFFMMGAYTGALLNGIGMIRSMAFYKEERTRRAGTIWTVVLIAMYIAAYILTFTVFGTPATATNLILEALPTVGMSVLTISFNMTGAGIIRILGSSHSCSWLIYNIAHRSIGGALTEAMSLISIIIGIIRYDLKKKEKAQ